MFLETYVYVHETYVYVHPVVTKYVWFMPLVIITLILGFILCKLPEDKETLKKVIAWIITISIYVIIITVLIEEGITFFVK